MNTAVSNQPASSPSRLWVATVFAIVGGVAIVLLGAPIVKSLSLTGRLESLGVTFEDGPSNGIKVSARQTSITDADLAQIAAIPDVTHLDLYGCKELTAEGFAHLGNMKSVEKLNLTGTQIEDLAPLENCTRLTAIALDQTQVASASLRHLRNMSDLTLFTANQTKLTNESLVLLGPKPDLNALYVANTQVTGEALRGLEPFTLLETLNLSGTQITDADLAAERWPRLDALRQLFLNDLPITDAGLANLQGTIQDRLPRLESLGLSNTRITSASFNALRQTPQLSTIRLSGTPIPKADIEQLRLDMPNSYIEGN